MDNNGFDATQISAGADYSLFDAIVLIRETPSGSDSTNLANYVQNGGHLVTEWDSSDWALDTANLLNADDPGNLNFIGNDTNITFTTEGLAAGLGDNIGNSYADSDRTQFFRDFSNIGTGVDILGTRPTNIPAIIGGASGLGTTIVLGYDWADNFSLANSGGQQILINALNYSNGGSAAVPFEFSPTLGLLAVGGVFGVNYLRKRLVVSKFDSLL